jgi:fumarate hydratase subunit beta
LIKLQLPISKEAISKLKVGDIVKINGTMVTARDAAHKYLIEHFIDRAPKSDEMDLYRKLSKVLDGGMIYHCGPVVIKENGGYRFTAAGPTTSIREEPYEAKVIGKFGVRGVIGKGGMGDQTLAGCREHQAVYLHNVGGAASLIAKTIVKVEDVYLKEELGVPEAFWVIRVENFDAVVTMDSHGNSLHKTVAGESQQVLDDLSKKI